MASIIEMLKNLGRTSIQNEEPTTSFESESQDSHQTSKQKSVQGLPFTLDSVLVLSFEYLDSPSIMSVRSTNKRWKNLVDETPFLWDFYYIPKGQGKKIGEKSLEMFTNKSGGLKGFKVDELVELGGTSFGYGGMKPGPKALAIKKILMRSKESLRYVSYQSGGMPEVDFTADELKQFKKLETFLSFTIMEKGKRFEIREMSGKSTAKRSSLTRLHLGGPTRNIRGMDQLMESSSKSLVHLHSSFLAMEMFGPVTPIQLPRLAILETQLSQGELNSAIGAINGPPTANPVQFYSWLSCPALKVLCLAVFFPLTLPVNLPDTLEEIWLVGNEHARRVFAIVPQNGFMSLETNCPLLERFNIDTNIGFPPQELIQMIEARKEAAGNGVKINGVQMKSIKKLAVDPSEMAPYAFEVLKGLVEELVDVRTLPDDILLDC